MNYNCVTREELRAELAQFLQEIKGLLSQPSTTPQAQGELVTFTFEDAVMEPTGNIRENGVLLYRQTGFDRLVNHNSHSGSRALEIPVKDSNNIGPNIATRFVQLNNIKKGQQLTIEIWAKGDRSAILRLDFTDAFGGSIGGVMNPPVIVPLTPTYTSYKYTIEAARDYSETIKASFQVDNSNQAVSLPAYVDDLQVKMVERRPGLCGQYYNGTNFNTLVHTQVDSIINVRRETGQSPAPGVNVNNYSVRWKGYYLAEENNVSFKVTTDDGVRLWVYPVDAAKPTPIIQSWKNQSAISYTSAPQYLEKGKLYHIEYESYNGPGAWVAKLESSANGSPYKVIPSENYFYDSNACNAATNF
ncbi:PA14 domain-containing protein [Bacillus thuringiensis]|uniref:PA14 domain-containing protein n=1 Tax=Bacillus thuringiensis TaxID=1428 RepID=UPI000E514777|nr:PA14 domain-containing protein [Bacillus thuringiensis]MDZ3952284.1 PA14 domain-containing protein [Bacillus thuringiensis]RGP53433.1 hypothetical protein BTW32_09890 [Bacillus thuringiensis]